MMAPRPAKVTQAEVEHYLKAAAKAGVPVTHWDITPDGTFRAFTAAAPLDASPSPCDRLLR